MFNFFHQFIDTVLFLGERRGGDYFWGNLWTRENEGEEAVFKKRRQAFGASIGYRGIASRWWEGSEGNGCEARQSSHQLRLIGFVGDKRRRAGWDGRKKGTKQAKRPNTGGRENQFQKWKRGMIPLFLFFQLVASPLFFFFFFFFFHDLITDPFCNQLPRKMNRCFLIGRIPFSTPLCTRFERKIFPSEYTNGVKCARIDKRRVDVL